MGSVQVRYPKAGSEGAQKLVHFMTLAGAGAFGLAHLFHPTFVPKAIGAAAPAKGETLLGDAFVGSSFLAFAICSLMAIRSSRFSEWAAILKLQCIYKTIWVTQFLKNAFAVKGSMLSVNFGGVTGLYAAIFAGFIFMDLYALNGKILS